MFLTDCFCQFGVADFELFFLSPQGLYLASQFSFFLFVLLDKGEAVPALLLQIIILAGESV